MSRSHHVVGVLLAGGRAQRMGGGGKAMRKLAGKPLLQHVITRLAPQVSLMVLNANGDPSRFAKFGLPVVEDPLEGYAGPLAGVLAGLDWTHANAPDHDWIATIATDTPFFPKQLVDHLLSATRSQGADMACAASAGRHHPVFGLWPVALRDALRDALISENIRKVDRWTARYNLAVVNFEQAPIDPFFNVNQPEDLQKAEAMLTELQA